MDNPVVVMGSIVVGLAGLAIAYLASDSLPEGVSNLMGKKYKVHRKIGNGAFGTVYLVENSKGKLFALKTVKNTGDGIMSREPKVMKGLRHPNVTQLYDLSIDTKSINMVMDYMSGGSLQDRLNMKERLSQSTTRLYFLQLCKAIDYLHTWADITHRDLKPDNILLASNDEKTLLKVSDFGLSKNHVQYYLTSDCGTKLFMAPEYWRASNNRYSSKVDIWSLGVILFNCLSGDYPFYNPTAICNKECNFTQSVWKSCSEAPINIIKDLLAKRSELRPDVSDILKCAWLEDKHLIQTYDEITKKFKD